MTGILVDEPGWGGQTVPNFNWAAYHNLPVAERQLTQEEAAILYEVKERARLRRINESNRRRLEK